MCQNGTSDAWIIAIRAMSMRRWAAMGEARSAGNKTAGPRRKEGGCKFGVRWSAARRTRIHPRRWRRRAGASRRMEARCHREGLW